MSVPEPIARMERLATRRSALGAFGAFIAATLLIQTVGFRPEVMALASGPLPETAFGYSPAEVESVLGSLGAEGRSLYVRALLVDFLFVIAFAAGLGLPLAYLLPRATERVPVRALALAPVVAGACDYVENLVLLYSISTYPDVSGALVAVASVFTSLKVLLLPVSMLVLLVAALLGAVRVVRARTGSGATRGR